MAVLVDVVDVAEQVEVAELVALTGVMPEHFEYLVDNMLRKCTQQEGYKPYKMFSPSWLA